MEVDRAALELCGGFEHELVRRDGLSAATGEETRLTSIALFMMRDVILLSGLKLNFSSGSWLYCLGGAE